MDNRFAPAGLGPTPPNHAVSGPVVDARVSMPRAALARSSLGAGSATGAVARGDVIEPLHLVALLVAVGLAAVGTLEIRLLATVHAAVTLLIGLRYALVGSERALYVCGYFATADVLWRMTKARVPWEFGKYGLVLLMIVIMVKRGGRKGLLPGATLYLAMLLPSIVLTIDYFGLTGELRDALSFNLSGPVALAVSIAFVSGLRRPERLDLARFLLWMLVPVIGVFAIAFYSTLRATRLDFGDFANLTTSGGFGPNQVSASLGLGALISLLLMLHSRHYLLRLLFVGIAVALQLQNLLTFSRGGTFNLLVALAFFGLHFLHYPRLRRTLVLALLVSTVVGTALVLPKLDAWTSGSLSDRFTSLDTTGRKELAQADLRLFEDHFVFGVGPGLSKHERQSTYRSGIASHTEFSRLVAEHGLLGLLALGMLMLVAFRAYRLAPTVVTKGWVAGMAAWSLGAMSHSGMRIVAISFVFGLATLPFHRIVENRRHLQRARARALARQRTAPRTAPRAASRTAPAPRLQAGEGSGPAAGGPPAPSRS